MQLHIREDHQDETGEDKINNEETTEEVHTDSEKTSQDEGTSSDEKESDDTSVEGVESSDDTEEIGPVEITPISYDKQTEEVVEDAVIEEDNPAPAEDIAMVVVDDNSEDESEEKITSETDIPILPRETILKLLKNSEYFRSKPTIFRAFEPSFKNFDIIDSSLPRGFLVWEQVRASGGRHTDREFLSPDGQFVLRSRVAAAEYSRMILGHARPSQSPARAVERRAPVKRRSGRLTSRKRTTAEVSLISPEPKRPRLSDARGRTEHGKFKDKLKARLSSTRLEVEDDDLMVLSSSLPASTRIRFQPAPFTSPTITRAGVTITPVLPATSGTRKKIKCCDMLFVTTAGFESHRAKKHSNIVRETSARKPNLDLRKELPSSGKKVKVDYSCEYCEEKFSSKTELKNHDQKNHKYKCTFCKEAFVSKLAYLEHTKANHIVSCSYCKDVFKTQEQLKIHLEKSHSFQCKNCDENFKLAHSLSKHFSEKHTFPCSSCSHMADTAADLETHTEAEHGGCEICEDDFYWADSEHECFYTRTRTRPPNARVQEQRLYRGYFFFSADD